MKRTWRFLFFRSHRPGHSPTQKTTTMESNQLAFISLEDVDADSFLLGDYTKSTLPNTGKQSAKNDNKVPLNQMSSPREREAATVRDLLYVLTGKEGLYVKYTDDVHQNDILKRLKGNTYKVSKDIDINFKDISKQLCQLGKQYSALSYFSIYFNKSYYGKVLTRFCEYIRNFLKEYQASVCRVHSQFENDPNFSIVTLYQLLHNISDSSNYPSISKSLEFLYSLTQQIIDDNTKRLKDSNLLDMKFDNIMKSLKEDMNTNVLDDVFLDSQNSKHVKGGVVLNMVYSQLEKFSGDIRSSNLFRDIYEFISLDYIQILNEWLQYGKVSDPFYEFFIVESPSESISSVYDSYYWMNKYAIKREGLLKQFYTLDFQRQIFFTGKYLAIINECNSDSLINTIPFKPIKSLQDKDLELIIHDAYLRSNNLIYQLLYNGYQLPEYISLLNKYFLITDGSLFDDFLNLSNHELKRGFNSASKSLISSSYNSAYRTKCHTTAENLLLNLLDTKFERHSLLEDILEIIKTQVTDANEIFNASNLGKLSDLLKTNIENNTRPSTLSSSSELEDQRCNKLAISRFNINIMIPFPLNQVILDSQKLEYQIIFRHLALVKFMEKRFEKSWRELGYQTFWTWNFEDTRVRKWIKRCRFIHTKMFDFIRIYSQYSNYDVVECNWSNVDNLLVDIVKGGKNFDLSVFKTQITEFLSSSMCDLLLSQSNLVSCLHELLTLIIVFHEYVMSLRKALLLMDENLLNIYKERLNLSMKYTTKEKEQKLSTLISVVDSYHLAFQKKLTELCEYLGYYGEIDSPKMLALHSKLVSSFKI